MISKKMMTFLLAGTLVVGGITLGNNVSTSQSKNQPNSTQQKAEVAYKLTAESETQEEPIFCGLAPESEKDIVTITNEVDMYNVVLDYFIGLDEALNSDMKYIAVNFEKNISNENKEKIIENLKKYNVDIIEGDLEELLVKGLGDEYGNLYGILISISDLKIESENKLIIKGSKYRSGLGSVSNQVILKSDNGTWKIEASTLEFIS